MSYLEPGYYEFTFDRSSGLGCAASTVLGFNGSTTVTFRISCMFCSASQDVFDVRTCDRSDQEFLLQVAFTS